MPERSMDGQLRIFPPNECRKSDSEDLRRQAREYEQQMLRLKQAQAASRFIVASTHNKQLAIDQIAYPRE